jgi:subtilisin family serine protease
MVALIALPLALVAAPASALTAAPVRSAPAPLVEVARGAIAGQYVVVLADGVDPAAFVGSGRAGGVRVTQVYGSSLNGFAARLSDAQLSALRADPSVAYVAQDGVAGVEATQASPPWHLDRIDQFADMNSPSNSYTYDTTGAGVTAYVIDSGIRATHTDFSGRVSGGANFVSDGNGTNDCHGHGTAVAGVLGGETYGVAKDVSLVPVRVLPCVGNSAWSVIIAGIDWATANHTTAPAVANLSLGRSDVYAPLVSAVAALVADGVTVAMSAGNDNTNACTHSPGGSVPTGITVAGLSLMDYRTSSSNYGSCVDISAPGEDVYGPVHTDNTTATDNSGTSFAAPQVAGVAALYLQNHTTSTPAQVKSAVLAAANPKEPIEDSGGSKGTPAKILYSRPGVPPTTFKVQHRNHDTSTSNATIKPGVKLVNLTGSAVPLSNVTVRYWFTRDSGASTYTTFCDAATIGCGNVTRSVTNLGTPLTNANAYLQVGFSGGAGSIAAAGNTGEIRLRIQKTDSSNFSETNDYSYRASSSSYVDVTKVTGYVDGILVWGTEPS